MFRRALLALGHQVLEASDGREGIRVYEAHAVDLVITDILMPDGEGLQCILDLRRIDPSARVIAISGGARYASMDVLDVARRFGGPAHVSEALRSWQVLEAVQETLDDSRAA